VFEFKLLIISNVLIKTDGYVVMDCKRLILRHVRLLSAAVRVVCVWRTDRWARRQLNVVEDQPDRRLPCVGAIRAQFHDVQVHKLLVVCKSQLIVYDASNLDRLCQVTCTISIAGSYG
jgi:hypothetical protein